MQVFISYSREDSEFALRLRDEIRAQALGTWLDVDDIPKGAYWPEAIDDGLESADMVVGVMTSASLASRNVKNEWDWAIANDKPLILLMLRPCSLPHRYISLNYIDLIADEARGMEQFRKALHSPERALYLSDSQPVVRLSARLDKSARQRNRERMLEKVRNFWIKGVLENSLHGAALIELGMEGRPEAVDQPWDRILRQSDSAEWTLPQDATAADLFDKLDGKMLILGEPGAGKTTTLLELARDLVERAWRDAEQPIPVVFNLASWSPRLGERKMMADWLMDELSARYQVPRTVGQGWLEEKQLLPLLDGLDEVPPEHRESCVQAINHFLDEQGLLTDLAVCSRVADYHMLHNRLKLQGAIVIQPLTSEQIDRYLLEGGAPLAGIREILQTDVILRELAQSPLILSMMTLAYRHMDIQAIACENPAEIRQQLFATYVNRMLEQRGSAAPFPPEETRRWLTWLAHAMSEHGQTLFFIEGLQPDWLPTGWQRRLYFVFSSVLTGISTGLLVGVLIRMAIGIRSGMVFGLMFGVAAGLVAARAKIRLVEMFRWSWQKSLLGLPVGVLALFLFGGIASLGYNQLYQTSGYLFNHFSSFGLASGIAAAVAVATAKGLSGAEVEMRSQPNQGIWRSLSNANVFGLIILTLGAVGYWLTTRLSEAIMHAYFGPQPDWWANMLTFGFAFASSTGLAFGMAGVLVGRTGKTIPRTVLFGLLAGLIGFAIFGLTIGLAAGVSLGWYGPLSVVMVAVISASLVFGGLAVIQHGVLRFILYRYKHGPLNYARFLDYAASRVLLRKVGGGYIFVHRLLLEYFAGLEAQ